MACALLAALALCALLTLKAVGAPTGADEPAVGSGASTWAAPRIGMGINLGNTLEPPFEGDWNNGPAQQYYFTDFAARRFQTVRIPVRWDNHTMLIPPYTVNATWMARVQQVVGWCLGAGLQCIVNSHHDFWLDVASDTEFAKQLPRYSAIWRQVAAAFADAPEQLMFESFNEPSLMSTASLNAMLAAFHAAVRPTNPNRTLILGWLHYMNAAWIQQDGAANWNAMRIPGDGSDRHRLLLEAHSYDPHPVCFSGSEPWGRPADVAAMGWMFGNLSQWSGDHGLPVFMGEGGCTLLQKQGQRVAWYRAYFQHVNATDGMIGGMLWDGGGTINVYNRTTRTWDEEVMTAIGLGR